MNMNTPIRRIARRAALALAVSAGAIGLAIGGGGATGTGYTADGPISQFGSIFVNGIEFFTDDAAISVNGVPNLTQRDLRLGMVLTVDGSRDAGGTTGQASTVVYNADAIGAVDRALDSSGSISVLGQNVSANARTVFAGVDSLAALRAGDNVEVSGYLSPAGILAARVEKIGAAPFVQVQGTVGVISGTMFALGNLAVDLSSATLENVPLTGLVTGMQVIVKGPPPSGGVLAATQVAVVQKSYSGSSNGSTTGVIASLLPTTGFFPSLLPSAFTISGQAYLVTPTTQYVNGNASSLARGRLVKVDFAVVATTLIATRVEFE
jgi:hypothetical protein